MSGIQDIPLAYPGIITGEWFRRFVTEYLSKADIRNATGNGLTITSNGNGYATLDATADITAHEAALNPHPQYPLATDLGVYTQKNAAEVIEAKWTFPYATPVITEPTTVGSLPSAATAGQGARAFVTDSNTATFNATVAAGGSNKVPCFSDGTNWKVG